MSGGRLEGKVAIVTAAGRGIGRGIALRLAEAGADLVVNSYGEDTTRSTAEAVEATGRKALQVPGDITDPEKMLELTERALETYGQIDVLVNNVGAGPKSAIEPEPGPLGPVAALWDALYQQNLRPVVLMTEAVLPHLIARKSGRIIHISSIAGRTSLSAPMLTHFVHNSYGAMRPGSSTTPRPWPSSSVHTTSTSTPSVPASSGRTPGGPTRSGPSRRCPSSPARIRGNGSRASPAATIRRSSTERRCAGSRRSRTSATPPSSWHRTTR